MTKVKASFVAYIFRGSLEKYPPNPPTPVQIPRRVHSHPVPRVRNQTVSWFQSASRVIAGTRSGGPAGVEAILRHSVGQGHGYASSAEP